MRTLWETLTLSQNYSEKSSNYKDTLIHWNLLTITCHSSDDKESTCNAGDPGLIPGSGRSSGEGQGNPLQSSCLENPMDRGAWQVTVCGVTESDTIEWLTLPHVRYYSKCFLHINSLSPPDNGRMSVFPSCRERNGGSERLGRH